MKTMKTMKTNFWFVLIFVVGMPAVLGQVIDNTWSITPSSHKFHGINESGMIEEPLYDFDNMSLDEALELYNAYQSRLGYRNLSLRRFNSEAQDLTDEQVKRSVEIQIQVSWSGGERIWVTNQTGSLVRESYSNFLNRRGMSNIVVEYWTQSGGNRTNSITGKRIADATAGEDYEDVRGTLNFLPMLPYWFAWKQEYYRLGEHVGRYSGGSGTAKGFAPALSNLPNFLRNDRTYRINNDRTFPAPSDLGNTMDYQITPIRYRPPIVFKGSGWRRPPGFTLPVDVHYYSVGRQSQSVFIPIIDDDVAEPTFEYFEVFSRVRTPNNDSEIHKSGVLIFDDDEGTGSSPPPVNVGGGYVFPGVSPSPPPTEEIGQRSSDLRFTSTSLSLAEGESATYQVRATASRAGDMVVNIATSHSGITVNPSRLTFYSHNWQTFQTVTVTASADAADINEQASIRHSIPASPGFIANNNAGIVSVTLAHTVVEEEETQSKREIVKQLNVPPTDYDLDDDGLIEISNLEQLNAIRWDLNGDGKPDKEEFADDYDQAFPSAIDNLKAQGYELAGDLDFGDNPTGWESIGVFSQSFQAVFEGNNHVIVNLFQDQSDSAVFYNKPSGLFGAIGHRGQVMNLGMEGVQIKGVNFVGALAGFNQGRIGVCSALGRVEGVHGVGGLVGQNFGDIRLSIAEVEVQGVSGVGDLVGIDTMAR